MRLATTIGDFKKYVDFGNSPAQAVRLFEGTGFKYLDYDFYSVIYPGSPFLGDKWMDQVKEAADAAAEKIRKAIAENKNFTDKVCPAVAKYIIQNKLYK